MTFDSTSCTELDWTFQAQPELFSLMLDSSSYASKKKASSEMYCISRRLETAEASVSLADLAHRVGALGQSFVPALLRGGRKKEHWVSQQIFALDFDHGVTFADFQRTCAEWSLVPAFVYATFSHTPAEHRFRAVFALDQPVHDFNVRNALLAVLLKVFPDCDTCCKDASRLFLGGRQLLDQHVDQRINPVELWESYFAKLKEQDPTHFKRNAERFCAKLGVDASVGFFGIQRVQQGGVGKMGEKPVGVKSIYTQTEKPPILTRGAERYSMQFLAQPRPDSAKHADTPRDAQAQPQMRQSTQTAHDGQDNAARQKPRLDNDDKQTLRDKCRLLREFIAGERHVPYAERRLILSNLYQRENGIAWYKEGLASRQDYHSDYQLFHAVREYDFHAEGCANCPYADECEHRTNLLQQIPCKRRECRPLTASPTGDPVEKTRLRLSTAIQDALLSDDTKVHVIRCGTGVGKTQALLQSNLLDNVCIAFPTHRLAKEAYDRLGDSTAFLWPERPKLPGGYTFQLDRIDRMRIGSSYKVFLRALSDEEVRKSALWVERIREYLKGCKALESEALLFTTHEKAFQVKNPAVRTFVFDEDPLKSLLQMTDLALVDVESFLKSVQSQTEPEARPIEKHLKHVLDVVRKKAVSQNSPPAYSSVYLRDLLARMPFSYACPIEALFTCCAYAAAHRKGVVHCIEKRPLHPDRKCVVLSATADEAAYRAFFGERLHFVDLGSTAMKGRLVCHRKKSYSKGAIKADSKGFADEVMAEMEKHGFEGIITHKFLAEERPDGLFLKHTGGSVPVFATFGALSGLDSFGGKDIAVFGTPHIDAVCYRLHAQALGLTVPDGAWQFAERTVERNGFEFSFTTCSSDPGLANLQLSLIEAELLQAVGRARLVNNDCTVRVYSNLPLRGAELV